LKSSATHLKTLSCRIKFCPWCGNEINWELWGRLSQKEESMDMSISYPCCQLAHEAFCTISPLFKEYRFYKLKQKVMP